MFYHFGLSKFANKCVSNRQQFTIQQLTATKIYSRLLRVYRLTDLVADDGVDVGEVGLDELRLEERRFLERSVEKDDVDDVVADVTLPVELQKKNDATVKVK